ncbi:MAG: sensor histidine kinase [Sedimentibacter sp.]
MGIKEGKITLKTVFLRYLLTLCLVFVGTFVIFVGIVAICFKGQLLLPANYSETLAQQAKTTLESVKTITEDMIPVGCNYVVFDKNYNLIKTNLNIQDVAEAQEYTQGNYQSNGSIKNYYVIRRQDGVCVLQYFIGMRYSSVFLQQHFPSVQKLFVILFIFLFIVAIFFTSAAYAKILNRRLGVLISATNNIRDKNLDFSVTYSGIKEFDDVILSLSEMKSELKHSLEQQWNLEQTKKEQISALAHDLKTPLTIIKGNTELLSDTTLSKEQREYINYISKNTGQIDQYIKTLMEISNSEKALSLKIERTNTQNFIDIIHSQLEALANTKSLGIEITNIDVPEEIVIDPDLLYRAIMNVISNAVDYSPKNGKIYFEANYINDKISFIITDSGKGFSSEDIESATKQFYMGDRSRASKVHYGIGLFIAEGIIKLHGGILEIANSSLTGGGQVTIIIPNIYFK